MNAHGSEGNAIVSLIRSSAEKAEDIGDDEVRQMVRDAVGLAGGLDGIVKDGQFVVIKPNLISARTLLGGIKSVVSMYVGDPYSERTHIPEKVNGLTVDWRVTKAMVELIRELNPSGTVAVMESSGDGYTGTNFKELGYTDENIPGVDAFLALDDIAHDFRAIESTDLEVVDLGDKQLYKKLPKFLENKYYFSKFYYHADVIISLACLKNHMNAAFTGAIKNVGIGAMPGKIYGTTSHNINRAMTIDHSWEPINAFIHDYYLARPVDFALTDGLQGLAYGPQGQGAHTYDEAKMNMRLLLASRDPVALDAVHAYTVGVDAEKVPYLTSLSKDGLGVVDTSRITVVGNARVDEVKKAYPFAKGILGTIYKEPAKTRYDDFDGPSVSIDTAELIDRELSVTLSTDAKTAKVELYVGEQMVGSFADNFGQLVCPLSHEIAGNASEITVYAYDRYLNCGHQTAALKVPVTQ